MTRKKVKLQFIANESSRKATFKKRTKGFMKKVYELSTLCGIKACAIVKSPFDSTIKVWPSDDGVLSLISEFVTLPVDYKRKKMVDQKAYLEQSVQKAAQHLKKQRRANREYEMTEVLIQCLEGNMNMFPSNNLIDLNDLGYLIDKYQKDVNRRIEILRRGEYSNAFAVAAPSERSGSIAAVDSTTAPVTRFFEVGSSSSLAHTKPIFNPSYQEHLNGPYNEIYDDMHNHSRHDQMSYAAEQIPFSFMEDSQHYSNHHIQSQENIDSSTAPTTDSSSSGGS